MSSLVDAFVRDVMPYFMALILIAIGTTNFIFNLKSILIMKRRRLFDLLPNRLFIEWVMIDYIGCFLVLLPAAITSIAGSWVLSNPICFVHGVAMTLVYLVVFALLILRCVERTLKMKDKTLYKKVFYSKQKLVIISLVVWLIPLVIALCPAFGIVTVSYDYYHAGCVPYAENSVSYLVLLFLHGIVFLIITIIITYVLIFRHKETPLDKHVAPAIDRKWLNDAEKAKQEKLEAESNFKAAMTNFAVCIVMLVMWTPYFFVAFIRSSDTGVWRGAYTCALLPILITFVVKPVVYYKRLAAMIEQATKKQEEDKKKAMLKKKEDTNKPNTNNRSTEDAAKNKNGVVFVKERVNSEPESEDGNAKEKEKKAKPNKKSKQKTNSKDDDIFSSDEEGDDEESEDSDAKNKSSTLVLLKNKKKPQKRKRKSNPSEDDNKDATETRSSNSEEEEHDDKQKQPGDKLVKKTIIVVSNKKKKTKANKNRNSETDSGDGDKTKDVPNKNKVTPLNDTNKSDKRKGQTSKNDNNASDNDNDSLENDDKRKPKSVQNSEKKETPQKGETQTKGKKQSMDTHNDEDDTDHVNEDGKRKPKKRSKQREDVNDETGSPDYSEDEAKKNENSKKKVIVKYIDGYIDGDDSDQKDKLKHKKRKSKRQNIEEPSEEADDSENSGSEPNVLGDKHKRKRRRKRKNPNHNSNSRGQESESDDTAEEGDRDRHKDLRQRKREKETTKKLHSEGKGKTKAGTTSGNESDNKNSKGTDDKSRNNKKKAMPSFDHAGANRKVIIHHTCSESGSDDANGKTKRRRKNKNRSKDRKDDPGENEIIVRKRRRKRHNNDDSDDGHTVSDDEVESSEDNENDKTKDHKAKNPTIIVKQRNPSSSTEKLMAGFFGVRRIKETVKYRDNPYTDSKAGTQGDNGYGNENKYKNEKYDENHPAIQRSFNNHRSDQINSDGGNSYDSLSDNDMINRLKYPARKRHRGDSQTSDQSEEEPDDAKNSKLQKHANTHSNPLNRFVSAAKKIIFADLLGIRKPKKTQVSTKEDKHSKHLPSKNRTSLRNKHGKNPHKKNSKNNTADNISENDANNKDRKNERQAGEGIEGMDDVIINVDDGLDHVSVPQYPIDGEIQINGERKGKNKAGLHSVGTNEDVHENNPNESNDRLKRANALNKANNRHLPINLAVIHEHEDDNQQTQKHTGPNNNLDPASIVQSDGVIINIDDGFGDIVTPRPYKPHNDASDVDVDPSWGSVDRNNKSFLQGGLGGGFGNQHKLTQNGSEGKDKSKMNSINQTVDPYSYDNYHGNNPKAKGAHPRNANQKFDPYSYDNYQGNNPKANEAHARNANQNFDPYSYDNYHGNNPIANEGHARNTNQNFDPYSYDNYHGNNPIANEGHARNANQNFDPYSYDNYQGNNPKADGAQPRNAKQNFDPYSYDSYHGDNQTTNESYAMDANQIYNALPAAAKAKTSMYNNNQLGNANPKLHESKIGTVMHGNQKNVSHGVNDDNNSNRQTMPEESSDPNTQSKSYGKNLSNDNLLHGGHPNMLNSKKNNVSNNHGNQGGTSAYKNGLQGNSDENKPLNKAGNSDNAITHNNHVNSGAVEKRTLQRDPFTTVHNTHNSSNDPGGNGKPPHSNSEGNQYDPSYRNGSNMDHSIYDDQGNPKGKGNSSVENRGGKNIKNPFTNSSGNPLVNYQGKGSKVDNSMYGSINGNTVGTLSHDSANNQSQKSNGNPLDGNGGDHYRNKQGNSLTNADGSANQNSGNNGSSISKGNTSHHRHPKHHRNPHDNGSGNSYGNDVGSGSSNLDNKGPGRQGNSNKNFSNGNLNNQNHDPNTANEQNRSQRFQPGNNNNGVTNDNDRTSGGRSNLYPGYPGGITDYRPSDHNPHGNGNDSGNDLQRNPHAKNNSDKTVVTGNGGKGMKSIPNAKTYSGAQNGPKNCDTSRGKPENSRDMDHDQYGSSNTDLPKHGNSNKNRIHPNQNAGGSTHEISHDITRNRGISNKVHPHGAVNEPPMNSKPGNPTQNSHNVPNNRNPDRNSDHHDGPNPDGNDQNPTGDGMNPNNNWNTAGGKVRAMNAFKLDKWLAIHHDMNQNQYDKSAVKVSDIELL